MEVHHERKNLFDENWLFHLGDIEYKVPTQKGPIYTQAKTERFRFGPASKTYIAVEDDFSREHEMNPETWITVDLPHDYIIRQEPKKENNDALGYFKYENAWYRKKFSLSEEDKNKILRENALMLFPQLRENISLGADVLALSD